MDKKGYILIQDWMLDLPLSLAETVIYAVIYGFSQDGESKFTGSLSYLAKKSKVSKDTVKRSLSKLVEDGFIIKTPIQKNGVLFNEYSVCKMHGVDANCEGGMCKMHPNNKEYNKDIVLDNDLSLSKTNKRFIQPTYEEVNLYCNERGNNVDAQAFVDFYTSNGWKVGNNPMKDWKAAVRTWEKRDNKKKPAQPAPQKKESYFEHNNRLMAEMLGQNFGGYDDEL